MFILFCKTAYKRSKKVSNSISWSPVLSVGIDDFDEQHKEILNYLNKLNNCKVEPVSTAEMQVLLKNLAHYVDKHFSYEEKVFTECGYPKADEHKKAHELYRAEVTAFVSSYEAGRDIDLEEITHFLKDLFFKHIMVKDLVMAKYVSEHGGALK
jgi:hemerythrin